MSKHTPGPWTFYDDRADTIPRIEVQAMGRTIARTYMKDDQALCDARLIAAAPDLKALAVALDNFWTADFPGGPDAPIDANGHFRLSDDTIALWRQCRAAIAKAEGRQ